MFSTLKFSMLNSLGTRVVVRLFNNYGKIDYEILFPDIGASEAVRSSLSRADSDKFRRKLEKRGLLDQLRDSFYFELLQNLFATFLEMTYSDGLFDMKFLSEPEEEQTA